MIFDIPEVLTRAQIDEVIAAINDLEFHDGLHTASPNWRDIKKNHEAPGEFYGDPVVAPRLAVAGAAGRPRQRAPGIPAHREGASQPAPAVVGRLRDG